MAYVLLVIPFHLRPDNFIVDDGYFYLQIARNIASGYGSTFNRVMPTNGYHPLWMLFCVSAAAFVKSSTGLIQVVATISEALILLSIYLFIYICQISRIQGASAGIAVIIFMTTTLGIWRMLEADLSFAMQLTILALIAKRQLSGAQLTTRHALLMGCLLGLALLARLELIFFVSIVYAYIIFDFTRNPPAGHGSSWIVSAVVMGAAICLLVAPYLYWNYREFGHIVPISGAIKSVLLARFRLPEYCIPVILAGCLNLARFKLAANSPFATVALLVSVSSLSHLAYSLLFGNVAAWYLTTGYMSVAICATWLFEAFLARGSSPGRQVAWSSAITFVALGVLGSLRLVSNFTYTRLIDGNVKFGGNYTEPKRALAEKLRRILPPESRIYVFDGPGGIAYYSGMSVIPTDGLVSDYSYNSQLLTEGVGRYMAQERIDYIIAPALREGQAYTNADLDTKGVPGGQEIEIFTPLHHKSAGAFLVSDEDKIATFATVVPNAERSTPGVALWRINH
jgi:hypothetical protein